MSVQELIEKLSEIEDKTQQVYVYSFDDFVEAECIYEHDDMVQRVCGKGILISQ